ncbi:cytosolic leucyl tRNA synthetase [Linderina pennispora]|nr:cytosolic leucyl tRNA synthetase [Linderina pennispora]
MMYRDALKSGFYDFQISRDWYREVTAASGMHPTLVRKWIVRQIIQLSPITTHWSEQVWRDVLGNQTTVLDARWPADLPAEADHKMLATGEYIRKLVRSVRDAETNMLKKQKKPKKGAAPAAEFNPNEPKTLDIYVAAEFPEWQDSVMAVLQDHFDPATRTFADKQIPGAFGKLGMLKNKKVMPFAQEIKKRVLLIGESAFDRQLHFSELDVLAEIVPYLKKSLGYSEISLVDLAKSAAELDEAQAKAADSAVPGEPSFKMANI